MPGLHAGGAHRPTAEQHAIKAATSGNETVPSYTAPSAATFSTLASSVPVDTIAETRRAGSGRISGVKPAARPAPRELRRLLAGVRV
jgi:hypothetical protein